MSPEAVLARLKAQNAERQRRYRERQKAARPDDYSKRNAERQRRYRERQAALNALPSRILAHVQAHSGVYASAVLIQSGASLDAFIDALMSLVNAGRVTLSPDHRLFLSEKR